MASMQKVKVEMTQSEYIEDGRDAESIEQGFDTKDYLKHLMQLDKEFLKEIGLFFAGAISASLGILTLLKSTDPDALEILKDIFYRLKYIQRVPERKPRNFSFRFRR